MTLDQIGLVDEQEPVRPALTLVRAPSVGDRADIGACRHEKIALHDEWQVVRCTSCGERLEPYAVLKKHAQYWETLMHDFERTRVAYRELVGERIRMLCDRAGVPPELRNEARTATLWGNARHHDLRSLLLIERRLQAAIFDARNAKRQEKRRVKLHRTGGEASTR